MGIVEEDIARVREATDIVALITQRVALKRVGRGWSGLCPFHDEKTPSFSVSGEKGVYYCFGCGKAGDAIDFVRETEHLDFQGAVEHLAHKANISLRYTRPEESGQRLRRNRLVEAVEAAVDFYHQRLLTADDAGEARRYLRARGFDGDLVRRYRIGYAPDGWDVLARHLKLSDTDLEASGLGRMNRAGRQQDWFRARIVFPIFEPGGDPIGFGGRIMPGRQGPKYLNTPECALYQKSRVLYGLNWAKDAIVRHRHDGQAVGEAIVCEGYTDVIAFDRAGIGRAVATCGTSLTEDHVRLLRRFASRIVLAFDADEAGQSAAARFYEWERRYEIDVAVADLPPGVDPDELAGSAPDRLRAAVDGARPFLEFRVGRILADHDLDTPEHRARVAEAALRAIREHPSELVRDQYLMTVADRCRLDPDRLRSLMASLPARTSAAPRRREEPPPPDEPPPVGPDGEPAGEWWTPVAPESEEEAIRWMVADRDRIVAFLHPVLFTSPDHRGAFVALRDAPDLHEALAGAAAPVATVMRQAAVTPPVTDPVELASRLADLTASRVVRSLEREARDIDDFDALKSYTEAISWVKRQVEKLRESEGRGDALSHLVPWLGDHGAGRTDV